jgi:hypothetical protein
LVFCTKKNLATLLQIDADCIQTLKRVPVPARKDFTPLESVKLRISRDYEPYPLDVGLSPVHEGLGPML